MMELFRLQMRTAQMLVEASSVINIRMLGMAGVISSLTPIGRTTRANSQRLVKRKSA